MSSIIWLLDRSRVVDGRGFCQRARYLGYHTGPNGYGIAMKATKLPLMTGIAGHDGLAPVLQWCAEHDELIQQGLAAMHTQEGGAPEELYLPIPFEIIRAAVAGAQAKYATVIDVRGFAYLDDEDHKQVVREQNYLIEGMIWAWCLEVLPEILRRARILEVEHDDTFVFDCTCGLGDGIGTKADHEARDCQGKGLMCRPDFLSETRDTNEVEYHEFKTTGMDSITFRDKWEVMIQMFAATLDAERRLNRHVQSIYIHGLIKGKRGQAYNPESGKYDSGPPMQQSVFCYGFKKSANPPMEQEQWAATYDYVDEEGKNRKLGKLWRKAGVWELPDSLIPEGMSKGEFWTKWIPSAARRKSLVIIGPLSRQTLMVDHFLVETSGEENRWQTGLWTAFDLAESLLQNGGTYWGTVWTDREYQLLLDRLFPRSYECRRYGARMRCQFETICFEREGHADPIGSGQFIERRPHHKDELEAAIQRGLILPDEGATDEIEQEF